MEKRARLEEVEFELPKALGSAISWATPRQIDTVEWFATGEDLARSMLQLHELAAKDPTVLEVLTVNPGLAFCPTTWPTIGYKGGSEPGVFSMTWLLRRHDDRVFVLSLTVNDSEKLLDENAVFVPAGEAIELLAEVE